VNSESCLRLRYRSLFADFIFFADAVVNRQIAPSKLQPLTNDHSLLKNEIHREDKKNKPDEVIHLQCFVPEENERKDHEYGKGNHLLDDLKLNERKWPAIAFEANPVGGHL